MKRMIDGLINYSVKKGYLERDVDNDKLISVEFYFPFDYYPFSMTSEIFSILPGRFNWGNDTTNLDDVYFNKNAATSVSYGGGHINISDYPENSIAYNFTFRSKEEADEFAESLFGATSTGEYKFAIPIYMLLARFYGKMEY